METSTFKSTDRVFANLLTTASSCQTLIYVCKKDSKNLLTLSLRLKLSREEHDGLLFNPTFLALMPGVIWWTFTLVWSNTNSAILAPVSTNGYKIRV